MGDLRDARLKQIPLALRASPFKKGEKTVKQQIEKRLILICVFRPLLKGAACKAGGFALISPFYKIYTKFI